MEYVTSFRDLKVYKLARKLAKEIFERTKSFPKDEQFSLTSQVRRSSRSMGAQIPEAWAKRRYINHFINKLTDADGEQQETQHWIETSLDCGYLTREEAKYFIGQCEVIGRMLSKMMDKADSFCGIPPKRNNQV